MRVYTPIDETSATSKSIRQPIRLLLARYLSSPQRITTH